MNEEEQLQQLLQLLDENDPNKIAQIKMTLGKLGFDHAMEFAKQTPNIQRTEIASGKKRRTLSAIYATATTDYLTAIKRGVTPGTPIAPGAPVPQPQMYSDAELVALYDESDIWAVTTGTVKVTLVGRPAQVRNPGNGKPVAFRMKSAKTPELPKGITLPGPAVECFVLIHPKTWGKVSGELASDEGNRIMVDGFPVFDDRFKGVIVVATGVTIVAPKKKEDAQA